MMLAALVARKPKVCGWDWVGYHFRTSSLRTPLPHHHTHRLRISLPMTWQVGKQGAKVGGLPGVPIQQAQPSPLCAVATAGAGGREPMWWV